MQDTSKENKQEKKHYKGCFSLPVLLVLGLLCLIISYLLIQGHQKRLSLQATETAESSLTIEHGDEAREAIERFENNWLSLPMYEDPEYFYAMLLTGPMLEDHIGHYGFVEDKTWSAPIYNKVISTRVLDYSDQQLKVIACIEDQMGEYDHAGNFLNLNSIRTFTKYYVFIKDDGIWKLAGSIDLTIRHMAEQEWTYLPQEYQTLFGDFYAILDKDCFGDK